MASHRPFGHLSPLLRANDGPGVKVVVFHFDSRPLKVENRLAPDVRFGSAIRRWKDLDEGYNFGLDLVAIRGQGEEI
jgi:hypothetical protein